jgi:hypothetical protein
VSLVSLVVRKRFIGIARLRYERVDAFVVRREAGG